MVYLAAWVSVGVNFFLMIILNLMITRCRKNIVELVKKQKEYQSAIEKVVLTFAIAEGSTDSN